MKSIVIYGNSAMAEVTAEYINACRGYRVVAFTVDEKYIEGEGFAGKPLIACENLESYFAKDQIELLVLSVEGLVSTRQHKKIKSDEFTVEGYRLFTFIDPSSYVAKSAKIGKNCIIMNRSIVEPGVVIEDGVFLRSESYVSHGSRIGAYSYLAPRATVAGKVKVGLYCFLGVNCTIHDRKVIGDNAIIGGGAVVNRDVPKNGVVKAAHGVLSVKKSDSFNI